MPRSNYWSHVAQATQVIPSPPRAIVEIDHEGVLLHFQGGTIWPSQGHKALAIPLNPAVAGQNPREYDPSRQKFSLVWPKGSSAGTLRDKKTNEPYYLLVSKASIPSDQSVLPGDEALIAAGIEAIS